MLLAKAGRIPLFDSRNDLLTELILGAADYQPERVAGIDVQILTQIVQAPASTFDLDAAAAWLRQPDRKASLHDANVALEAMNLADDIGVTLEDERIREVFQSLALDDVHDALTLGLTFIGEGSPFYRDPVAISQAISDEGAEAALRLISLASEYIDHHQRDARLRATTRADWA